jgi:hypothetical protein
VGRIEAIPGTRKDNALIVVCGDQRPQVWVRPFYTDYRLAWQRAHLQMDNKDNTDVDHIYNRARAMVQEYGYVRLFACERSVNRAYGAGYERLQTNIARRCFERTPDLMLLNRSHNEVLAKMRGLPPTRLRARHDHDELIGWLFNNHYI